MRRSWPGPSTLWCQETRCRETRCGETRCQERGAGRCEVSGRFDGKVAVITGAAAGFGLAVATRLASEGARLVLVDRAAGALHEAAEKLDGLAVVADVSEESEVDGYVRAAVDAHGRIDLFFNN